MYSQTLSKKVFTKYCAVSWSRNAHGVLLLELEQHVAQFFMFKTKSMNGSVLTAHDAQRTFDINGWLNAKSDVFSTYMGETVTNLQVVLAHMVFLLLILTIALAGTSLPLALVSSSGAAWAVYRLNMTEKGGEA